MLVIDPRKQLLNIQVRDSIGFTNITIGTGEVRYETFQPIMSIMNEKSIHQCCRAMLIELDEVNHQLFGSVCVTKRV